MKRAALIFAMFVSASLAQSQWTQVVPTGSWQQRTWPSGRGWTWLLADGSGNVLEYAAITPCGDPFSNSIWSYSIAANKETRLWWSGAGDQQSGACASPKLIVGDKPTVMGDRHPMHQSWFDTSRQEFDQYGGITDTLHYFDNFHFNVAAKSMQQDADAPAGMNGKQEACIAYDPVDDVAVMFGGDINGGTDQNTWVYKSSTRVWSLKASSGPSGRIRCTLIWEPYLKKIMLFGGVQGSTWFNDLWTFDVPTSKWTKLTPTGTAPSASIHFLPLAHDSKLHVDFSFVQAGATYEYNPATNAWSTANISGGPAACPPVYCDARSLAYDAQTDTLVMQDFSTNDVSQVLWTVKPQ